MREIKFRAKNTINGGWVVGYYFVEDGIHKIHAGHTIYPVHSNTVGQFTGFHDKHGTEIYEGDFLQIPGYYCEVKFIDGGFHTVYNHPEDGEILPIADMNVEKFQIINL